MQINAYALTMFARLKERLLDPNLSTEDSYALEKACGCGLFIAARYIDDTVASLLHLPTVARENEKHYLMEREVVKQWEDLGFDCSPEDMDADQIDRLKQLAAQFSAEDTQRAEGWHISAT